LKEPYFKNKYLASLLKKTSILQQERRRILNIVDDCGNLNETLSDEDKLTLTLSEEEVEEVRVVIDESHNIYNLDSSYYSQSDSSSSSAGNIGILELSDMQKSSY
jgi:hypothetical protein